MAIDPNEFQAVALQWIGVIAIVATAIIAALTKVMGEVKQLMAVAKSHSDDIRSLGEQNTALAAQIPAVISTSAAAGPVAVVSPASGDAAAGDRP